MNARRLWTIPFVVMLLVAGTARAAALEQVSAHMIAIDNSSLLYHVMRHGASVPISFTMALLNGDVITIDAPSATMTIRYVDSRDDTITSGKSPYVVQSAATATDQTSNFVRGLWEDVTKSGDSWRSNTSIRDIPLPLSLTLPGLTDGSARIAAGKRHFMVAWHDGIAPYRVVLRDGTGKVLVDEQGLSATQLTVDSQVTDFAPGQYAIEITDASGAPVKGSFRAMAGGMPRAKEHTPKSNRPDEVTEAAAELLVSGDRSLAYEAYLELYPAIDAKWQPAQELAVWISQGAAKQ